MTIWRHLVKPLWQENPTLVLLLGMCPTLAVTTSARNALGMGLATTLVLAGSNTVISALRRLVPAQVRIPLFIVIIAVFVSVVDMLMKAYTPAELYAALGIYIPLIVVNCIVMGRAEAFAQHHAPLPSFLDGLGMGLGFTFGLLALGCVREFFSGGTLFDLQLVPGWRHEFLLLRVAPGAFLVLGVLLALRNALAQRRASRAGRLYVAPPDLNCRYCRICKDP